MNVVTGIVVYFMLWWIILLLTLPIGFVPQEKVQTGNAKSAPEHFNLKKTLLLTTGVTMILFLILYGLIEANVFSFRELVARNPKW